MLLQITSFNGSTAESKTIDILKSEIKRIHLPHYAPLRILVCDGHPSQYTYGGLIITDSYKGFIKLKGWNIKIFPMLIISFIVHEQLHSSDEQKGVKTLIEMVKQGKLESNFTDFDKYSSTVEDRYNNIGVHYYVCLYTYLWMMKAYGKAYTDIIEDVWQPYNKFEKYIRDNHAKLTDLMKEIGLYPPKD
jgi:hypothetical protein